MGYVGLGLTRITSLDRNFRDAIYPKGPRTHIIGL